jgi:hypothetical protein
VAIVLRAAGPGGANVLALDKLLEMAGSQDKPGADLLHGLPLVGELQPTNGPTFTPQVTTIATADPESLTGLAPRRDPRVRQAVEGPPPDRHVATAIWEQTKKEMSIGLLSPPIDFLKNEPHITGPITVRFGIKQLSSAGKEKIRTIDDFKASGVNSTVSVSSA